MAVINCVFAFEIASESCIMHDHTCTELVFHDQAEGFSIEENQKIRYSNGTFTIYQPGYKHATLSEKTGIDICVGVSGLESEQLPIGVFDADNDIVGLFMTIRDLLKIKAIYKQDLFDLYAGLLVTTIKTKLNFHKNTAKGEQRIDLVKEFIDTRFQENISLDDIAAQLYMSKPYLRLLFKKKYGTSPLFYLIAKRIDKAKYLLNYTELPVKEVGLSCGFENPYYFSKMFKQETGFSPSDYRFACNKKAK